MSTLRELAQANTDLGDADIDWLHLLVGEWQLVADLSFADLVLWVRVRPERARDGAFLAVAQMRPTTAPTSYQDDQVGVVVPVASAHVLDRAWRDGRIVREGDPEWSGGVPVRQEAIPVRRGDRVVAVVGRDTNLAAPRMPSQLELTYLHSAGDLVTMIAEGRFPFPAAGSGMEVGPRVGDGLLRIDAAGRIGYASPNAQSAYRRLGVSGDVLGADFAALAAGVVGVLDDPRIGAVGTSYEPHEWELEARGTVVAFRSIPLLPGGSVLGALVLVHDVTEVRRRDRELVSKDATIREIHHRVKNNLQTVAALLRLQARRLGAPEARAALEESVRRVSSIALVHETLSLTLDESVVFDEIADRVIAMVGEVAVRPGAVEMRRSGSFGVLPAAVATPLSMVLTELLQNAVEHAFADGGGLVDVRVRRSPERLRVAVVDDGRGLPPGFLVEHSPRLGLQIVRTLAGELGGDITLCTGPDGGTQATLDVPVG